MNQQDPKIKEDWEDFKRRVIAIEKKHAEPIFQGWNEKAVVATIAGLIIIGLYNLALRIFWIYLIGSLLFGCGIAVIIALYALRLGTSSERSARLRLIKQRGKIAQCKFLKGSVAYDENTEKGFCTLYLQNLEKYPYCIYCKNYSE